MASQRLEGAAILGYLPENGPLYPDMTPRALLDFFADARGMPRTEKKNASPRSWNSALRGA